MKKLTATLILTALLLTQLAACTTATAQQLTADITFGGDISDIEFTTDAIDSFAASTFATILESSDPTKNTLYSPISTWLALALLHSGAKGDTAAQLQNLLMPNGTTPADYAPQLLARLYQSDEHTSSIPSVSLWIDDAFADDVKPDFLDLAAQHYKSSVYTLDFAEKSSSDLLRETISRATNGMIEPNVEFDAGQLMSIVAAYCFADEWTSEFDSDATKPDIFYAADGSELTLDFLNKEFSSQGYTVGEGYLATSLSTKSGANVTIVLPDEALGLDGLLEQTSVADILDGGERHSGRVVLSLPKIDYSVSTDLKSTLQKLGVTDVFAAQNADLTGITDGALEVGGVVTENRIALDEKGVSAASYTQITFYGAAPPDGSAELICNRPFILILRNRFGIPLFIGTYVGE